MVKKFRFDIISNTPGRYRVATLHANDFLFECGQYIKIVSRSGKQIPLSIASSPLYLPKIKIIYRPEPGNPDSLLLDDLLGRETVEGTSPLGLVKYPLDNENLVLICKGTGISQAASMAEHCKLISSSREILLIWNTDKTLGAHEQDSPEIWFPPINQIISNHLDLLKYLETQRKTLKNAHCIITGDPEFVHAVHDLLSKHNFSTGSIQSDVFEYSPRNF